MKKTKFCLFIFLLLILISCNNNTSTPENMQKSYVPIFKTEVTSRGLINMVPEGNPFTNMKDASNIMTSLPLMVGISEAEGSFDSLTQNLSKQNGIGDLGFDIRLDSANSKQLSDGSSFLIYNVYEDDQQVGFIEYVYNPATKSFSYRQSVMLTICNDMGMGLGVVPILVSPYTVEYTNIPLTISNGKISYVVGEYKDNSFINNGIADFIMLQYGITNSLEFQRQILSSKFDNGIYYSVYRPTSFIKNLDTKVEDIKRILSDTTNGSVSELPINKDQAKVIKIDTLNSFIKYAYKSGEKIVSHNYSSFGDFNAASIKEYNFESEANINADFAENPVCYDTINKKTASAKYMDPTYSPAFKYILDNYDNNNIVIQSLPGLTFSNDDNFGFPYFHYILENTDASKKAFIKNHLMNCGIPEDAITEDFLSKYKTSLL